MTNLSTLTKQEQAKKLQVQGIPTTLHISFTTNSQSIQRSFSQSSHLLSLPSYSEMKAIGIMFGLLKNLLPDSKSC